MKRNNLLRQLFKAFLLVIFSTPFIFSSAKAGGKKDVTSEEVDELAADFTSKNKVATVAPPAPPTKLRLCRQIGTEISAKYFLRQNTVINFQGVELHRPGFFVGALYHLEAVENLLNIHKVTFGALRRNHLIANSYVAIYNTTTENREIIEGTLYARKIADAGEPGGSSEIEWLMRPNNAGTAGYEKANFMSSSPTGPVDAGGCLPLSRADVRPLSDDDNHGDRLALDTFKNNPDLFFSLIRRTAHREDLQIISMGTRYFSSYDACDNCHTRLYQSNQEMRDSLTHYATRKGYTFFEEGVFNAENSIPFSTFFYASRPYVVTNPGATYYGEDNEHNRRKVAVNIHGNYNFPNVTYRYARPSLIDYDIDGFQICLNNGVVNKATDDRTIWTYIDKLRDGVVGGPTFP